MEQLPKCLDGPNHAGNHIRQVQHAPDLGLDAIPSAGGKFTQQLAIKTCVNSQTLGDGKRSSLQISGNAERRKRTSLWTLCFFVYILRTATNLCKTFFEGP